MINLEGNNSGKLEINIAFGSKNKAKIRAVEMAFGSFFPHAELNIFPVEVDSEVSNQPIGINVIIKGAKTRAIKAYEQKFENNKTHKMAIKTENKRANKIKIKLDKAPAKKTALNLGVGIESGLERIEDTISNFMDFQFCAIYIPKMPIRFGCGSGFEYPNAWIQKIVNNEASEIGEIVQNFTGIEKHNSESGAIGLLTKNLVKRADILANAVKMALIPLVNDLYKAEKLVP